MEEKGCIFCQIIAGKIPSKILYQDEGIIVFPDVHPQAPTHMLILPKKHIPSLAHITPADSPLIVNMVNVANQLAKKAGIAESGYRLAINVGSVGQFVPHLHLHLLGGRLLGSSLVG